MSVIDDLIFDSESSFMQRTVSDTSVDTAASSPGQHQLEQTLLAALNAGRAAITDQIHAVLAYSQMLAAPISTQAYQPPTLNVVQARLAAMLEFSVEPAPDQVKSLYRRTRQINNPAIRLSFQARLLKFLPTPIQTAVLRDIWKQLDQIEALPERAQVLLLLADQPILAEAEPPPLDPLTEIIQLVSNIPGIEARLRSLVALSVNLAPERALPLFERILNDLERTPNDTLRSQTITQVVTKLPPDLYPRLNTLIRKIKSPIDRAHTYIALALALPQYSDLRLTALNAISAIPGEEDMVAALIEFAPALEGASVEAGYPETLQQALGIIVGLNRRPLRAKALVALAAHLTPDLKGEALAAVHSVSSEHERAALLAQLVPILPPSMFIASLAVAHTMREADARAYALRTLAYHVPIQAREQTMRDAFASASSLPNALERVQALVSLLDILPDDLQAQALEMALQTIRLIENENPRARALSLLCQHLQTISPDQVMRLIMELTDPQQRLNVLVSLAPHLQGEVLQQALQLMLNCARQMPFAYRRARALVSIAAFLTPTITDEMLALAETLHDPYDRVTVYIALSQNLPPEQRPTLIANAWALLPQIDDGYDRASALAAIAPFLASSEYSELVRLTRGVIETIGDEYEQASAIGILASMFSDEHFLPPPPAHLPTLVDIVAYSLNTLLDMPYQTIRTRILAETVPFWLRLKAEEQFHLWYDFAWRLKALPLADVLLSLSVIVPVIRAIGGNTDQITQILNAQRDKQPGSKHLKTGGDI